MTPTLTLLNSLEDEVAYLLGSKAELRRSSAALSALETLYEELESAWQDLNTPPEQKDLESNWSSFEQKKNEWRRYLTQVKKRLAKSKQELAEKRLELTMNSEQLTEKLVLKSSAEWEQSAKNTEEQRQLLAWSATHFDARMKTLKKTLTSAFKQGQSESEKRKQRRTANLTEQRQNFEQLKRHYEASTSDTTSLANWKQALTERKQTLQLRRESLRKLQSENVALLNSRDRWETKQPQDLHSLIGFKTSLESEHASFLLRRNKLIRAGGRTATGRFYGII
jgi:hypothetical protein